MKKYLIISILYSALLVACTQSTRVDPQPKKITIKTTVPSVTVPQPSEKTTTIILDKKHVEASTQKTLDTAKKFPQ